jgi:hypothetical protein
MEMLILQLSKCAYDIEIRNSSKVGYGVYGLESFAIWSDLKRFYYDLLY